MNADFNPPINITPMSATEARECIDVIKGNLESLRLMLLELHRRSGWEALGYASWEDCALAEFGKSRSYVFQLVAAAEVEENLASVREKSTIVDLKNIPVSHLTVLAKLPPEQQAEGLLKAEQIAQAKGKKRNATHVAQAVKEIKQPPPDAVNATPTAVEQELEQKAEELGLPTSENQVLPDVERNHSSPLDVDDRPFANPLPIDAAVNQQPELKLVLSEAVEACLGDFTMPESLDAPLQGNVYISPCNAVEKWSGKLLKAYQDGSVREAIALLPLDHQAFVKFVDYVLCPLPESLVAVYLGKRVNNFIMCFEDLGTVWHRYGWRPKMRN